MLVRVHSEECLALEALSMLVRGMLVVRGMLGNRG
jgi:hypothetical protein